ncbi:hypothetical protein Pmani_013059 [Petrolisthes manimaculis]|uniref:Uncharacterized protein n=1 Tax=Petrolisthes manimaculis TaxID=1843537 RepID=A0AAE1PY09_9EUCA|nr:hypothetical protein Pmani_013059 [Petrolisthes manimaculis]
MLLRIHALHRLLLQYLALPVLLLTFSGVCQTIVCVYFITIFSGEAQVARNITTFSTTFLYCFPLLFFPNIPVLLLNEMDEVKVLLQTLLHRHQEPNIKAQVSSFVVTYLIILLQFRSTENN